MARAVLVVHGAGEPRRRRGRVYWEPLLGNGLGPDFPEFALPPDFGARLREVRPVYLYHSRDDPEIPLEHLERYGRALPHAIVRILDGRGHEFNQPQFPELAADIRRQVQRMIRHSS